MSKKAYVFMLFFVFLTVFSLLPSTSAQLTTAPDKLSINQPYFYYTQVHYREIENVRIFVECPLTNSNFGKQNVTFRLSIHDLKNGMEIVIVKNGVVLTLEKRMIQDSYYIQPIYIDNPLGTNCSIKVVLKTQQSDFTVLELIYVVNRLDPSLPYDEYTHYWTDNMVDEAEEKLETIEKEKYIKIPQSDYIFTVIGVIIGGVLLFLISEWLGIAGVKRTLIKSRKLSRNPVLAIALILTFAVVLLLFFYYFLEPIALDQEARLKAKYLGTEYLSPIPATEWLERISWFMIFSLIAMIWFFGVRHGWKLPKIEDAFMAITVKDNRTPPGVDIVLDVEEGVLRPDPNNPDIQRFASIDKLSPKEGMKRIRYGIAKCTRVLLERPYIGDELEVRLREYDDDYKAMLLDERGMIPIDERVDAQYTELQDRLNSLYEELKDKGKLTLFKKLKLKLIKAKTTAMERDAEHWVMASSHINKLGALFDKDIAIKAQLSEREAVKNSQDMINIARASKHLAQADMLNTLFRHSVDQTAEAMEELEDTKKERDGFLSSINRIDKEFRAPEPEI